MNDEQIEINEEKLGRLKRLSEKLDDSIINELNRLYSEENLADLYFDKVNVIKKRRYIDFNLTVKNSGAINANGVKFSIFDDGELIKTFDLKDQEGEVKYGAGIIIGIENLAIGKCIELEFKNKTKEQAIEIIEQSCSKLLANPNTEVYQYKIIEE